MRYNRRALRQGRVVASRSLRHTLLALVAASLLVSCDGGSKADKAQPPITRPSTTTTIDVSKVPPVIDVPYVQAVMNALDQRTGDMVRTLVANKVPNAEFAALMQAIYDEPEFSRAQSEYGNYAARGLGPLSPKPGDPVTRIRRLVDSSANCIVAEIDHDYRPIFKDPSPPDPGGGFIQLRTKNSQRDPANRNPTAWIIVADIDAEGAQIPPDPCK